MRERHLSGILCSTAQSLSSGQVAFADRIIVNKMDLLSSDEELQALTEEIRGINRLAPIIYTQPLGCREVLSSWAGPCEARLSCKLRNSKVDRNQIIGIKGFSLDRVLEACEGLVAGSGCCQHGRFNSCTS